MGDVGFDRASFALHMTMLVYNLPRVNYSDLSFGSLRRYLLIQRVFFVATLLTRTQEGVLIAYFQDVRIIDETRIQKLGEELTELVTNGRSEKIILNFQNVSFMSSAMIGKLILFGKKCKTSDVKLRFCNINRNVEEVFELMNLDKVFEICKDEEKAIAAIEKGG